MRRLFGVALSLALLLAGHVRADDDVEAVRAANQGYYKALSARDLQAMEQVWSCSADDVNVAPPVQPAAHVGWNAIRKTYEAFWSTLDELTVSMDNPTIRVQGNVAWVYGIEQARRRTKKGEVSAGPNFGTSIFVKRDGRWLMVFHQAALVPQGTSQAAK
jgi:uncharacterized protein (TIGR02246 family)